MFQKVFNKFSGLLSYKRFILIILIAAIFIIAAIYVYRKTIMNKSTMVHPKMDESTSSSGSGDKTADLYLFYTDWCPHCKKTKLEWEKLKSFYSYYKVNGYSLNFIEVDCEANT